MLFFKEQEETNQAHYVASLSAEQACRAWSWFSGVGSQICQCVYIYIYIYT